MSAESEAGKPTASTYPGLTCLESKTKVHLVKVIPCSICHDAKGLTCNALYLLSGVIPGTRTAPQEPLLASNPEYIGADNPGDEPSSGPHLHDRLGDSLASDQCSFIACCTCGKLTATNRTVTQQLHAAMNATQLVLLSASMGIVCNVATLAGAKVK